MSSKHIRTDVNFAWPTAEIAVMGPEGAVNILYKREIETAADPAAQRAKRVEEFREKFANPYVAASRGFIDEVIRPRQTRAKLIAALARLETKRDKNPPREARQHPALTRSIATLMLIDRLDNRAPPLICRLEYGGRRFLRATDLQSLALGQHDLDGDRLFALVQECTTRAADQCVWEAHRNTSTCNAWWRVRSGWASPSLPARLCASRTTPRVTWPSSSPAGIP